MRKLMLAAVLVAIPSLAFAQDMGFVGYAEGSVGLALIPSVETEVYTLDVPGYGLFEGNLEGDYCEDWTGGAEIGLSTGRFRFGVGYDYASTNLDEITVQGTLDGVPFQSTITRDDIEPFGVSADNVIHIVSGNAYYNLPLIGGAVRPHLGLGRGGDDSEGGN